MHSSSLLLVYVLGLVALLHPTLLTAWLTTAQRVALALFCVTFSITYLSPNVVALLPASWRLKSFEPADWDDRFKSAMLGSIPYQLTRLISAFFLPPLPLSDSYFRIFIDIALGIVLHDITFWVQHRLLHTLTMWRFHKQHHEWRTLSSWAAFDVSIGEMVTTVIAGLFAFHFCGSVTSNVALGNILALQTLVAHSGTNMSWSRDHAKHHLSLGCNYGLWGIADRLFGTHKDYDSK